MTPEETNMAQRISQMMETHCKELNHLWEEFKGIKQKRYIYYIYYQPDVFYTYCMCSSILIY